MDAGLLKAKRETVLKEAAGLVDKAKAEKRDFTADEKARADALVAEIKDLDKQVRDAEIDAEVQARQKRMDGRLSLEDVLKMAESGIQAGAPGPWAKTLMDFAGRVGGAKQLITPSGGVGVPALSGYIPAQGEQLESVLQVLSTTPLEASSVEYLREVTRTHAADTVAESAAKPESEYELEEIDAPARVIAHLSKPAPRTWFADAPGLQRYLDTVLRLGLQLALEYQVLNGTGVAPDLDGMLTVAGHQVQYFATDMLATCRQAITLCELISVPTSELVFVFNPLDWESMELLTTTTGAYQMNDAGGRAPINRQQRTIWSVPVALSTQIAQNTGLLFHRRSVQLYEREAVELTWSENTYDSVTGYSDFQTNQIRWRAEGRWCLALYRPEAIVEIDFLNGS